jgi:succinylarginine dihydrolase
MQAKKFQGWTLMWTEINVDGLVGPTHHYGGLGVGNLASQEHAGQCSHPRAAALEGVRKAALVASWGVPQYLLLPPARPRLDWLEQLALDVGETDDWEQVWHTAPEAFSAALSSAFMWAANAATVSAAGDCSDRRLHITPANLISSWHRSAEADERRVQLSQFFKNLPHCTVHSPLPAIVPLRDEGAANHMRLCDASLKIGLNIFVYGDAGDNHITSKLHFLPRQTRASCEAIARRHRLDPERTFFLQQHPEAISAGAFHNDVVATSHEHLLIHHQLAFVDAEAELTRLEHTFQQCTGQRLQRIEIPADELPLEEAVRSYFFNSQIITPRLVSQTTTTPRMVLISPRQCQELAITQRWVQSLVNASDNPIDEVCFVTLEQSMAGGGGPACLRLRVPLPEADLEHLPSALRLDSRLQEKLEQFIERWYPETLRLSDLFEQQLFEHFLQIPLRLRETIFDTV